jgi:RHS repeat-associated protein
VDRITHYTWDAENRLVGLNVPASGLNVAYVYDSEGQLVREDRGTEPLAANATVYLADKNLAWSQILEERDGAGSLKAGYLFADTQLLKQTRGAQSAYYHSDHLSPSVLTDSAGAILNRYIYSPFGEVVHQSGSGSLGAPGIANTHLFAGERFNTDSGLYYNRARWMDPRIGRFASIDPHPGAQGRPNTLNDYAYAGGNPVGIIDPTGQFGLPAMIGAMNIAVIAHASYTFLQDPTADTALDVASSHPTVFGALFVLQGVALASQIANDILAARGSRNFARLLGQEGHHTIPTYMCGHKTDQGLVPLPKSEHVLLHVELDAYAQGLEKAGSLIHKRFVKSRGSTSKVTLQQIGKNMFGRIGISASLAGFYTLFDYWSSGLSPTLYPGPQRKYSSIGEAFKRESPRFISGVTSCR